MHPNGFSDGNGRIVRPPDEVQYQFGARHGLLVEVFSDGDAYVRFFDNPTHTELVKWNHLCGVPDEFKVGLGSDEASALPREMRE